MTMEKIKIAFFDTKPYDQQSFESMNQSYGFEIKFFSPRLSPETVKLAEGFNVVCAFVNDQLNAKVIEELERTGVKLIALRCAGYNNVDLKTAWQRIHTVRVPAYSPHAVAEHTVTMMMCLNRRVHKAFFRTRDANFSIQGFLGFDMFGKTAGIIGTGKIGKCVVEILHGFGMNLLVYDAFPDQAFAEKTGAKYVSLEEIYQQSDVISLHCPLTPETHYLINDQSLSQMKDGVMIINTGRGQLIDTRALIKALKTHKVGFAGLDVYEEEGDYFFEDLSDTVIGDDVLARLLTFNNVLLTSHQAFFTKEALAGIAQTTLQNIQDFFNGQPLKNEICYQCNLTTCTKKQEGRCF